MSRKFVPFRVNDLRQLREGAIGDIVPFVRYNMAHVYVRLDFKDQYEAAKSADDARGFLRSVAWAAMAVDALAKAVGGAMLEVQGSILHAGIPVENLSLDPAGEAFAPVVHLAIGKVALNGHDRKDELLLPYCTAAATNSH